MIFGRILMAKRPEADNDHEILPPHLAVKAMRDSGYKDAAHAVAELIDNSIQAGLEVNKKTHIEVIAIDERELVKERKMLRIKQVAVLDDAAGMDAVTLRMALQFGNGTNLEEKDQAGIGKFGMGLPNASISRCQHVDVYSWTKKGKVLYSYLDIGEIRRGKMRKVPEPVPAELPTDLVGLFERAVPAHGTLVVWSKLDQIGWKSSKAFLKNSEFLVGRMYRKFLAIDRAEILLKAYTRDGKDFMLDHKAIMRPNDPLYLMKGTSCPPPFDKKPASNPYDEDEIIVFYGGKPHKVHIAYSMADPEVRAGQKGRSPIGKHMARNVGVSVVRADRELEMNNTWTSAHNPLERWWGIEVNFPPALDDIFGVSNTKQDARNLMAINVKELAETEGLTEKELIAQLTENDDPRQPILEISKAIEARLSAMRTQIARNVSFKKGKNGGPGEGTAEDVSTRVVKRRQQAGKTGESDSQEKEPEEKRRKTLQDLLKESGVTDAEAKSISSEWVRNNIKFLFQKTELNGPAIFDVSSAAGTIIIKINTKHPACDGLYGLLEAGDPDEESPELHALKLLLTAWARMEDEASEASNKEALEDTRLEWGRLAREFFRATE